MYADHNLAVFLCRRYFVYTHVLDTDGCRHVRVCVCAYLRVVICPAERCGMHSNTTYDITAPLHNEFGWLAAQNQRIACTGSFASLNSMACKQTEVNKKWSQVYRIANRYLFFYSANRPMCVAVRTSHGVQFNLFIERHRRRSGMKKKVLQSTWGNKSIALSVASEQLHYATVVALALPHSSIRSHSPNAQCIHNRTTTSNGREPCCWWRGFMGFMLIIN